MVEHMDKLTIGLGFSQLLNKPSQSVHRVDPIVIEPAKKYIKIWLTGGAILLLNLTYRCKKILLRVRNKVIF